MRVSEAAGARIDVGTFVLVATLSVMVLCLVWALLIGQPAAARADRELVGVRSTEVARLQTAVVRPVTVLPTPRTK